MKRGMPLNFTRELLRGDSYPERAKCFMEKAITFKPASLQA